MRTAITAAAAALVVAAVGNAAGQVVPAPVTPGGAQRQIEQTQEYYELQRRLEQPPPSENGSGTAPQVEFDTPSVKNPDVGERASASSITKLEELMAGTWFEPITGVNPPVPWQP